MTFARASVGAIHCVALLWLLRANRTDVPYSYESSLARLYPIARLSPPHRGALNLAVG